MQIAPIPENEEKRLEALRSFYILDTPEESDYDEIVKLASEICEVPMSLISLIDMNRQWFKARIGFADNTGSRETAFCTHAILRDDLMIVEDAKDDNRFFDNPSVIDDPNIRFYAGMPLTTSDGYKLGTLCVMDTIPRQLNDFQVYALKVLSNQIMNHLDKRLKVNQLNEALQLLNTQHQKLESLYAMNNRMLSIIGHDVRGPLSTLKSMLDMFAEDYLDANDVKEMSGKLTTSLKYTNDLIDNLLFWARTQFDQQEPIFETHNLYQKTEEIINLLSSAAEQKSNIIINNIDPSLMLKSQWNMVSFMIRNIISNSNKFTTQGSITISSEITGDMLSITIKDTGVGMPADKIPRLFGWENKMSTYGTSGEKGSGLGLSMSQEFAAKLGGKITAESEEGKGSVFNIILPFK